MVIGARTNCPDNLSSETTAHAPVLFACHALTPRSVALDDRTNEALEGN
jgi:hypothetical protein